MLPAFDYESIYETHEAAIDPLIQHSMESKLITLCWPGRILDSKFRQHSRWQLKLKSIIML